MSLSKKNICSFLALLMLLNAAFSSHSALSLESKINAENLSLSKFLGEELKICTSYGFEKVTSLKLANLINSLYSNDEQKNSKDLKQSLAKASEETIFVSSYIADGSFSSAVAYKSQDLRCVYSRAPPFIA